MAENSRFLMASTKKLQAALGRTPEDEHRAGLHQLVPFLRGHAGLLLTRAPPAEVEAAVAGFRHEDFARAGARATHTVRRCTLLAPALCTLARLLTPSHGTCAHAA